MKKIIYILGLALCAFSIHAQQPVNPSIISVTTAPSGACSAGLPNQQVLSTGTQYSCQSGTWAALAGGGSGGTPGGASFSVQYNNAGSFGGSTPCTGVGYFNTAAAPACATSTQIQTAIGSGVYDASGAAAAALASANTYSANASNITSGTMALARLPTAIPNANLANPFTTVNGQTCTLGAGCTVNPGTNVVYASKLSGATVLPVADCAAGASATGLADSYSALNTLTSAGSIDLEVDGCFALSAALNLASNTTLHGTLPGAGFIMLTSANAPVLQNVHLNAPTTSSGTTGFLVSNQTDTKIRVTGLMLNANATQAVTGTNSSGTAHGATPGGQFVYATNFVAVNGLTLEHNETYDSAAFSFFFSNDSYVWVNFNHPHQPTPTVASKFTDGIHFTGPDSNLVINGNIINAGDDSIAFNADDGNYPSSGDPNSSYIASYVKYGPIQEAHAQDNILDGTSFGVRTLSETNLINDVTVSNTTGTLCGIFGSFYPAYTVGTGNYGSVKIDGIQVTDSWSCAPGGQTGFMLVGGSFNPLQISHLTTANPSATYPILTQKAASTGQLLISDWSVTTKTSTFSSLINTTTSPGNLSTVGINWNDSVGSGSVFAGATVPGVLTCSNYTGPNLLLAGGYVPSIENGDCFTNTYTAVTTYVNTSFTEASSGAALAGTTPTTCTNGCVGPWALASGTDFTYQSGGGVQTVTPNAVSDLINTGVTNETIRYNLSSCAGATGTCAVNVRYTNSSNFIAINMNTTATPVTIYNVNGGTATLIGSITTGAITGSYTVVLNGTNITVTNASGTTGALTMTGTPSSSGTGLGFNLDTGGTGITMKISSLSAKSI